MKINFLIIFTFLICNVLNAQKVGTEIGDKAPNIKLPNQNGDTIELYSLKNQVVLIDFWASWCGPCRKENPHVVKAYNEYKNKNFTIGNKFTIYGVSLDKTKDSWIKAISEDNLTWINVSDLQFWNSNAAKTYNISSIPSNVLIDKDGIIVAKNLRGENLINFLEKNTIKDPIEEFEKSLRQLYLQYNLLENNDKYKNTKTLKEIKKNLDKLNNIVKTIKK